MGNQSRTRSAMVFAGGVALLSFAVPQLGHALELIDPNFSVCALGTTNVSSCGPTDPQGIDSTGASVGVIGGAGSGPLNPFLLFAVVPDLPTPAYPGSPAPAPVPGTSLSLTISLATSAQYGQTNTPVSGYLGEFTTGDIYSFAGLPGGNASMNFANLSGFSGEAALFGGTAPTSFSLYEFTVTIDSVTGNLGTSGVYDLPFTSLAGGTYLAAWGIEKFPLPTHGADHVYASPFTTAGFVGPPGGGPPGGNMPEPATLALIGLALLAAAGSSRRRTARD